MYGTKNIPSVGAVELAWVNDPLPPVKPRAKDNVDSDATMGNSSANGDEHTTAPDPVEMDYDVAEEDDRWTAS